MAGQQRCRLRSKRLGAECHVTGDTVRAVFPEESQEVAVDALRRERLRLVSLVPVRTSLEAILCRRN